ncbi:hypothetical protein GQ43DRAFT_444545 [Delitschia confertaspora ATCC 74209]|uniref:FAM192A/Fyv6 N-terminal domain-containing protein n=1 Tax=Delitschia confertaspora ATCC 74209 TaxID=1513339 RepID=A0A9P4MNL4_9PLEO|nr:hypothetical protein GQ43DRAFT_444545 [Delitschia confertaspora ATCC 74209]
MSSGFVSGGTVDNPVERDDEWRKAQGELEENRRQKEEAARTQGGKSLYEVLQANKAAKQEAFEESIKLKNQFRTLDDDEAEFINSVLESTREKEAKIKKETAEQLEVFRRHQEEAEKAARAAGGDDTTTEVAVEETQWMTSGRKRKKGTEKTPLLGLKLRKTSSTSEQVAASAANSLSSGPAKAVGPDSPAVAHTAGSGGSSKLSNGGASVQKTDTGTEKGTSAVPYASPSAPSPPAGNMAKPISLLLGDYSSDDD